MKDLLIWGGGALLSVIGVLALLYFSAPEPNTLPATYGEQGTGVL